MVVQAIRPTLEEPPRPPCALVTRFPDRAAAPPASPAPGTDGAGRRQQRHRQGSDQADQRERLEPCLQQHPIPARQIAGPAHRSAQRCILEGKQSPICANKSYRTAGEALLQGSDFMGEKTAASRWFHDATVALQRSADKRFLVLWSAFRQPTCDQITLTRNCPYEALYQAAAGHKKGTHQGRYSTVTDLARLRGWSTSVPLASAV